MVTCLSRYHSSLILGITAVLSFARGALGQHEARVSEQNPVPLPLSAQVVLDEDAGFQRLVPEKAHWKGQEYDIKAGIDVLLTVIKNPTTTSDERALAFRALGHLNRRLRADQCMNDLVALYPILETTDERAALLVVLNNSEDNRVLPLAYDVAVGDAEPRLRMLAGAALARWNIRRGVETLIGFFPKEEKGTMRALGVDALMLFDVLNQTKGWGCPRDDIKKPPKAQCEQSYSEAVVLAQSGFRNWFEQNKDRFPDWKPGDALPEVEPLDKLESPKSERE